jgi:hypothetical protein
MVKVKIIVAGDNLDELESRINRALEDIPEDKLIDVMFNGNTTANNQNVAMIVYNTD